MTSAKAAVALAAPPSIVSSGTAARVASPVNNSMLFRRPILSESAPNTG